MLNPVELDAYLHRIGHKLPCTPTLETRTAIHHAHACGIPFENLDPWLRM